MLSPPSCSLQLLMRAMEKVSDVAYVPPPLPEVVYTAADRLQLEVHLTPGDGNCLVGALVLRLLYVCCGLLYIKQLPGRCLCLLQARMLWSKLRGSSGLLVTHPPHVILLL